MLPLESGSYVVGKLVERMTDLKKNKTYVVLTRNEGCTYKRVIPHPRKKTLELIPDNAQYEKFEVPYHDILEMWEFACAIETTDMRG